MTWRERQAARSQADRAERHAAGGDLVASIQALVEAIHNLANDAERQENEKTK